MRASHLGAGFSWAARATVNKATELYFKNLQTNPPTFTSISIFNLSMEAIRLLWLNWLRAERANERGITGYSSPVLRCLTPTDAVRTLIETAEWRS